VGEWAIWSLGIAVADLVLATGVTIHAVLWKRDSRSVIGWVGLAWLAPFVGAFAYLCLGINRIERKAVALKLHDGRTRQQQPVLSPDDHKQREGFVHDYPNLVGLATAGRALTGWPLIPGNRVEPLIDGDQAYPAMLAAIVGAERSVSLSSYIFDSDRAGEAFLKELEGADPRLTHEELISVGGTSLAMTRPPVSRSVRSESSSPGSACRRCGGATAEVSLTPNYLSDVYCTGETKPDGFTARTEHSSRLRMRSAVSPINIPRWPRLPRVPMTTKSMSWSFTNLGMTKPGSP
jgi:hypothetical protein